MLLLMLTNVLINRHLNDQLSNELLSYSLKTPQSIASLLSISPAMMQFVEDRHLMVAMAQQDGEFRSALLHFVNASVRLLKVLARLTARSDDIEFTVIAWLRDLCIQLLGTHRARGLCVLLALRGALRGAQRHRA